MPRWIDATPAQRAVITARAEAQRRAKFIAAIDKVRAIVAEIEAAAVAIELEGGRFAEKRAARMRDEKTPYLECAKKYGVQI